MAVGGAKRVANMTAADSLREWLRTEVRTILDRKASSPPLVLWCDPERAWRDLLRAAAEGGTFELWSGGEHELVLRERLVEAPPHARVVWLPVAAEDISYLKVFELQAERVWTEPLIAALARYGVPIHRHHEADLRSLLPAHAREWVDQPRAAWHELTPGNAKSALVDDDQILGVLAKRGVSLASLLDADRITVFARRVEEDFGLPAYTLEHDDEWRVAATARLLVTEAAARVPAAPPADAERIIGPGQARDRALKLLDHWKKDVELMSAFEDLVRHADTVASLVSWARNVRVEIPPLMSRAVEDALLAREIDQLAPLESFEPLVRRLEERAPFYQTHAEGFWGNRADQQVGWGSLLALSQAAACLRSHASADATWKMPHDPVAWFTSTGWRVDHHGEILFREDPALPSGLHGVRARLRRAYLRHVDHSNAALSDLLHHHGVNALALPFAGEVLAAARPPKDPMATLVLDACRYDLGERLAELINRGEPARRAEVRAARAPLPSITALGMPFALADSAADLTVELTTEDPPQWRVTARDSKQDLTAAEARREWLRHRFKLKAAAITNVSAIVDGQPPTPKEAGRLLFVFGAELDKQGHEGELELKGADDYLERYVNAIRRLRDAGYTTVAVVTDHGFIHWAPEKDEVDAPPTGEVSWKSRRAIVGRDLSHPTAIAVDVPRSSVECRVPRSVNAFRTYGRIGFFHGGATLEELIIPVVVIRWPKKTEKVAAVLVPLTEITSLKPRIMVRPGASDHLPGFGTDTKRVGRQVVVKIVDPKTGRQFFHSQGSVPIEPEGSEQTLVLVRKEGETCPRGARLHIEVRDADNDERLDHADVELRIDLEEWD